MAISHIKSNLAPDWTGTVTVGNSTGGTQTIAATDLVRPTDWNSVHNQFYTLTGNTNNASTASGTNVLLSGGNNVTLIGGGATIGISVGNYITTARASNDAIGLNTANSNVTWTANSAGLSLDARGYAGTNTTFNGANVSGSMTVNSAGVQISASVAAQSNQTVGGYFVGNTTGQSSSSTWDARTISFDGAGIVSVGASAGTIRISATQSNQNVTGSNGGFAFQTLSFSNAQGVSFGTSAGSAIIASVAAQTNQTLGGYALGNTTGQSSSSTFDARTFSIEGAGFISVGWSNGSLRISGTQTNPVVSNAIASVGSATNAGTNTSRFAADDHVHAGVFSVGVSNVGNTAGDTRVDVGRFVFAGGNNITLSQATAANGLNTISIVGGGGGETRLTAYAVSNTTQSSSGTIPLSVLSFAGAGIASVGISNGSVIVSVPAGGGAGDGGVFAGVSTGGNTLGATGTVSTGNFVLVGSNGITLSQATGAAGSAATITILGDAFTRTGFDPFGHGVETVYGQQGAGTAHIQPMTIPGAFQFDRMALAFAGSNATNSSGSATLSIAVGIYTNNASTLSVLASTSTSFAMTASGTVGNYSLWAGPRNVTIPWTSTITGDVWVGIWSRTTTGGAAGMTFNQGLASQPNSAFSGILGVSSATNRQQELGRGIFSVSSTTLPSNMPITQIVGTGSLGLRSPIFYFASTTV